MTATDKTHVRITDGGTPEFLTWQEFCNDVEAAKKGVRSRKVRTVSGDDNGRAYHIVYADGRKVTVRPATDADQPAPAAVTEPELTKTMAAYLLRGRNNQDGFFTRNIRNGGGTCGALLRRGLIERRQDGPSGDAYYYTPAGLELAHRLAK